MPLRVRYLTGPDTGKEVLVGDDKAEIRFGRATTADVAFPDDMTAVSREHFGLRKEYGGYKFIINPEKPVFMNGRALYDDQALPREAEIALGTQGGPRLKLERLDAHGANQVKTEIFKPQREMSQDLRTTQLRSSRTAGIVAGIAALIVVLTAAGYFISQSLRSDVVTTQQAVAGVQQQIAQVSTDLPAVQKQIAQLQASNFDAAAIIEKSKESVYLVTIVSPTGEPKGTATASVVQMPDGSKALATNAHVGKLLEEVMTAPEYKGSKLFVAQSKGPDYPAQEVVSVRIHPGYDMFHQWFEEYFTRSRAYATQWLRFASPGFDVALLFVAEPEKLGPPLPVASRETIEAIKSGDPLVMIGFPMEGVDATDARRPVPISQTGRIIAMTTFFLQDGTAETNQLVAHSAPSVGGSSGSPMFNAKGEVVAYLNAGVDVRADSIDGSRIPSAVMINYAQRADMILDLMADTAKDEVPALTAQFAAADKLFDLTPEQQIANFMQMLSSTGGGDANVELLSESDAEMATPIPGSPKNFINSYDINADGYYAFLVQSQDHRPVTTGSIVAGDVRLLAGASPVNYITANLKQGEKFTLIVLDYKEAMGRAKDGTIGKLKVKIFKLPYEQKEETN